MSAAMPPASAAVFATHRWDGVVSPSTLAHDGFIGPLEVGDWRCPVCANDPADPTLHVENCPTIDTPAQFDPAYGRDFRGVTE